MDWTKDIFADYGIPIVTFISFGACAASMMSYVMKLKASAESFKPGDPKKTIKGLPVEMSITLEDYKRLDREIFLGLMPPEDFEFDRTLFSEPLELGKSATMAYCNQRHSWNNVQHVGRIGKAVSRLHNGGVEYLYAWLERACLGRRKSQRVSNHSEEEVLAWLDLKEQDEVLYIAFGSDVGPKMIEYSHIAKALEHSSIAFIWVIPPRAGIPKESQAPGGFYPEDLVLKAGKRGLVIYGWAPQLLILSHISTGGFLSHCGWNSTAEAIGRGVPFLTWPIRGDQFYNSKLIVDCLKIGYRVAENMEEEVLEADVKMGMEKLMGDAEMRERARVWRGKFRNGFPISSDWCLNSFTRFVMDWRAEKVE
ncbi:glucosyltransferase [Botrytis cinerea]